MKRNIYGVWNLVKIEKWDYEYTRIQNTHEVSSFNITEQSMFNEEEKEFILAEKIPFVEFDI